MEWCRLGNNALALVCKSRVGIPWKVLAVDRLFSVLGGGNPWKVDVAALPRKTDAEGRPW